MTPGSVLGLRAQRWRRSPQGTKVIRYVLTSGIAVVVGQLTLVVAFGLFGWTARASNYLAFVVAGVPSYFLNRRWAWGRSGSSHLVREVLPFWGLALLGLALSTVAVDVVDTQVRLSTDSRLLRTVAIMVASLTAFGLIWVAKFVIFNRYVFAERRPGVSK